jgi:hypothetical protein
VTRELGDRDRLDEEQAGTVLQGLDLPTLDAAGECGRRPEVARVRGDRDASSDRCDCDDGNDDNGSSHVTSLRPGTKQSRATLGRGWEGAQAFSIAVSEWAARLYRVFAWTPQS